MVEDGSEEVVVLLSVFNGGRFVREQLDSILGQASVRTRVVFRDDGSSDDSNQILTEYEDRFPGRFQRLRGGGRLGASGSFGELLVAGSGAYLAFSDQDDVWSKEKLAVLLTRMRRIEGQHGREKPILVHSDMKVVGAELEPIADSFWKFAGVDPSRNGLDQLLVSNTVTGCTVLMNRALADLAKPIPRSAILHDHWVALCASAFGIIGSVDSPLILYRQHGLNAVGAHRTSFFVRLKRFMARGPEARNWSARELQARAFLSQYSERLPQPQKRMLEEFSLLSSDGPIRRKLKMIRYGFIPAGLGTLRRIVYVLFS